MPVIYMMGNALEIKNKFIKELFENKKLTEKEISILFEEKTDYSKAKTKIFNTLLKKVISLGEVTLNLSHINFLDLDFINFDLKHIQSIDFSMGSFSQHLDLENLNLNQDISFASVKFNKSVHLEKSTFNGYISFSGAQFQEEVHLKSNIFNNIFSFDKVIVDADITFINSIFNNQVFFSSTVFNENANFNNVVFKNKLDCTRIAFNGYANFTEASFLGDTHFDKSEFKKKTYFKESTFHDYVSFKGVTFKDYANFRKCAFKARATLRGIRSKDLVNFSNSSFYDLDLENTQFSNANYLHISGLTKDSSHKVTASKEHFTNKESARLIKTHFEKQNNITESNKYFQIEQELYIDHLKRSTTEPNKLPTLTTLYLSKLISNFGTDWIRALLLLFSMGMVFMLIYVGLDTYLSAENTDIKHFTRTADILYIILMITAYFAFYTSTFYKDEKSSFWVFISIGLVIATIAICNYSHALEIQNYIIQLTNPINAFKQIDLYEGVEIYGLIVRIVITVIMYQLVIAFRQHTRRK